MFTNILLMEVLTKYASFFVSLEFCFIVSTKNPESTDVRKSYQMYFLNIIGPLNGI